MVRSALAPGLVGIRDEFGLTYAQGGLLATGFLAGYSLTLLPAGLLGDRVGRRRMVLFASLGWTVASLAIGLTASVAGLLVALFGLGLLMGCFNANDRPIVGAVTPRERMGLGMGLSYTGLGIGNGLGLVLGGVLASAYGWRSSYLVFAVVSLGAVAALWRSIPALPAGRGAPLREVAGRVLGSRDLWLLYVSGIPSVAAAWLLIAWAPTVLLEMPGFDLASASLLASGVGFAAVPALVVGGLLGDRFARRGLGRKGLIALGHLCLAVMCLLLSVGLAERWSGPLVAFLLVLTSLAQWSPWALIYALLAEMTPRAAVGMSFGLGASLWSLGSLTAPWLAGMARDASGSFGTVFFVMAGLSLGSALLALAIRPAFRLGAEPSLIATPAGHSRQYKEL